MYCELPLNSNTGTGGAMARERIDDSSRETRALRGSRASPLANDTRRADDRYIETVAHLAF